MEQTRQRLLFKIRAGSAKKENKDTIEDKEMAFIVWGGEGGEGSSNGTVQNGKAAFH